MTDATANFLDNRRLNKSQQMRWPCRSVNLLTQVRCTVSNGRFGFGFSQIFMAVDPICPEN